MVPVRNSLKEPEMLDEVGAAASAQLPAAGAAAFPTLGVSPAADALDGDSEEQAPTSLRVVSRGLFVMPEILPRRGDDDLDFDVAELRREAPPPVSAPPPPSVPAQSQRFSPDPPGSRRSPSLPPPSIRSVSNGPFPALPPPSSPSSRMRPASDVHAVPAADTTFSDHLVALLKGFGIDTAFGLTGGAVGYLVSALGRGGMKVVHCRHETGAVFAAVESYYASDSPGCVFATTGPGLLNAITGVAAARRDGAKLLLISGATAAPQRGRWAFQETSHYTMPVSGLLTAGPLFHCAATIEQPVELFEAFRRIASGFQKPGGFVAHLSLPITTQISGELEPLSGGPISMMPLLCADSTANECARLLRETPFAIWVGFGARKAWKQVRELARRTGAPVMCSPRGKGIFPEDHPQFLGVTGFGGHESVLDYMCTQRPPYILVLGTRLGEFTSFWSPDLVPTKGFIHVDIDPEVPGAAYPDVTTVGVQADIRSFLDALLARLPSRDAPQQHLATPASKRSAPFPRLNAPVRPDFLMQMIQRVVVEGTDAPVITEAGNAFAWGTNMLHFSAPDRYRVSTGFGSMGHAVTGVIGMAMARQGKAVAIAGDGAMLMNSEISTAVEHQIPAVWIVLNDSAYGMIHQGMTALRMEPVATTIPRTDFVMIARGMGADGVRVENEADVVRALEQAMAAPGPFVVDVVIDPTVPAPAGRRNKSLTEQAKGG
jgi:acetolactate synthase I/II/III large subunit